MSNINIMESNVTAISKQIDVIKGQVATCFDRDRFRPERLAGTTSVENLLSSADQTMQLVNELVKEKTEELVLLTLNSMSVLEADFEALDAQATAPTAPPQLTNAWKKAKSIVTTAIKAIGKHLWQIVATALTLKEWTVKGSLGSNIFGLASVDVSLKF